MWRKFLKIFKRYWQLITLALLLILFFVSLYVYTQGSIQKNLTVRILNVGQGDSILIQFPDQENFLIDSGPDATVEQKLEKYLPTFSRELTYVIPTHGDADHITGFTKILPKYKVENFLTNGDNFHPTETSKLFNQEMAEEIEKYHSLHKLANCGDKITIPKIPDLTFYILSPIQGSLMTNATNDNSIVILMDYGKYSFLFTGDISSAIEKRLVFNVEQCFSSTDTKTIETELQNLTVLKVAHHGSKYSSDESLLKYLTPIYSVISVGINNYGHPSPETLERLKKYSQYVLTTLDNGDITFQTDGEHLELDLEKVKENSD